jgi:PAS domain S-box-containing protein
MGGSELHRVLDILPDFVAQFDRDARFTYVNPAILHAFSTTREQLIGRTTVETSGLVSDASSRSLHASIVAAITERTPQIQEVVLETTAGSRVFEILHTPELDGTGTVVSVIGIARDITARKQAEAALHASERDYRTLAENTPDVIVRWDRNLRRIFGNPAFAEITGVPLDKLLGAPLGSEPPANPRSPRGSYLSDLARNVGEVFATGEPRTVALTRNSSGGAQILETRLVPERDDRGEIQTVLGIARDITRLQMSEREARTLSDHSPDVIARFDARGCYVYVNPTLQQLGGVPASAYIGRHVGDLLGGAPGAAGFVELRNRVTQVLTTGVALELELELVIEGKPILFDVRLIPEHEEGALTSVLAIGRDITARRALEDQLRQAQKMEAVGHIAGAIAHDFNNMLNVMQIHAGIALRASDLESSWVRVREILAATERAAVLTRELLAFSSRRSATLVEVDLGAVVATIAQLLGGSLGKAIMLETRIDGALPRVQADAGMIEQALTNLAINARDAMPGGGVVEVSITGVMAAARPGRHVCVTVRDTGCGIAPEVRSRIFEPYFTTKELGKGTGLGLATVFAIVQQHNGWIEVDSVVDRGTAFRLFFPALESVT